MDIIKILAFCFSFSTVASQQEIAVLTKSFCYGFAANWKQPTLAEVTLQCDTGVLSIERVQFERPNKIGDDDVTSVDPVSCQRDSSQHVPDANTCRARHRFDEQLPKFQEACDTRQSCTQTASNFFMHPGNLKAELNCNNVNGCDESTRNKSCFARRIDIEYRCVSSEAARKPDARRPPISTSDATPTSTNDAAKDTEAPTEATSHPEAPKHGKGKQPKATVLHWIVLQFVLIFNVLQYF